MNCVKNMHGSYSHARQKEYDKKICEYIRSMEERQFLKLFCLYLIFFWPNRTTNKRQICFLKYLQEQWKQIADKDMCFKRVYVATFLSLSHIYKSLKNLDECDIITKQDLESTQKTARGWSGPNNLQNKTDKFLSVYGVIYTIVNSPNKKGKVLIKWIVEYTIPWGLNEKIELKWP